MTIKQYLTELLAVKQKLAELIKDRGVNNLTIEYGVYKLKLIELEKNPLYVFYKE